MEIVAILNNSAVIAKNEKDIEYVLTGKGIAFGRHAGEHIDENTVTKKYIMSEEQTKELLTLSQSIPIDHFELSIEVITLIQSKINKSLDKSILIHISDHISSAIERYKKGIFLSNGLLNELSLLYSQEYSACCIALNLINQKMNILMPEDEAGFLCFHIIDAEESDEKVSSIKKVMKTVHDIEEIFKEQYEGKFDKNGINYKRFMLHLKFLTIRKFMKVKEGEEDETMIRFDDKMLQLITPFIERVQVYCIDKFKEPLNESEKLYLTVHACCLLQQRKVRR